MLFVNTRGHPGGWLHRENGITPKIEVWRPSRKVKDEGPATGPSKI